MVTLKQLILKLFPMGHSNSVSCHLTNVTLIPIKGGAADSQKLRMTLEYKQSLSISLSEDPRLYYYLSLCTDAAFVKQ